VRWPRHLGRLTEGRGHEARVAQGRSRKGTFLLVLRRDAKAAGHAHHRTDVESTPSHCDGRSSRTARRRRWVLRSFWLQPAVGQREGMRRIPRIRRIVVTASPGCDVTAIMQAPLVLLVQLPHVRSSPAGERLAVLRVPGKGSMSVGRVAAAIMTSPFSESKSLGQGYSGHSAPRHPWANDDALWHWSQGTCVYANVGQ